jgi:hypothetical protein
VAFSPDSAAKVTIRLAGGGDEDAAYENISANLGSAFAFQSIEHHHALQEPEYTPQAAAIGSVGSVPLGGTTLNAWGCWDSTCCKRTGLCLDRYRRYYRCCVVREKCERCIWPW